jgi:hypothetical protein
MQPIAPVAAFLTAEYRGERRGWPTVWRGVEAPALEGEGQVGGADEEAEISRMLAIQKQRAYLKSFRDFLQKFRS